LIYLLPDLASVLEGINVKTKELTRNPRLFFFVFDPKIKSKVKPPRNSFWFQKFYFDFLFLFLSLSFIYKFKNTINTINKCFKIGFYLFRFSFSFSF